MKRELVLLTFKVLQAVLDSPWEIMIYMMYTATFISLVIIYSFSLLSVSCHATIILLFTMCPLLYLIKIPCTLAKCILLVSAFKNFTIYSKRIGKKVITMNHVKMIWYYFNKSKCVSSNLCEREMKKLDTLRMRNKSSCYLGMMYWSWLDKRKSTGLANIGFEGLKLATTKHCP